METLCAITHRGWIESPRIRGQADYPAAILTTPICTSEVISTLFICRIDYGTRVVASRCMLRVEPFVCHYRNHRQPVLLLFSDQSGRSRIRLIRVLNLTGKPEPGLPRGGMHRGGISWKGRRRSFARCRARLSRARSGGRPVEPGRDRSGRLCRFPPGWLLPRGRRSHAFSG